MKSILKKGNVLCFLGKLNLSFVSSKFAIAQNNTVGCSESVKCIPLQNRSFLLIVDSFALKVDSFVDKVHPCSPGVTNLNVKNEHRKLVAFTYCCKFNFSS